MTVEQKFEAQEKRDFLAEPAPQASVALLQAFRGSSDFHDVVYQLNWVQLEPPGPNAEARPLLCARAKICVAFPRALGMSGLHQI